MSQVGSALGKIFMDFFVCDYFQYYVIVLLPQLTIVKVITDKSAGPVTEDICNGMT